MDPISQAGLGAVVAQSVGHRRLGFKAALIGAAAGALPDIDVFFSLGGDFIDQLISHRGITHSLIFAPLAGTALGWLVFAFERRRNPNLTDGRLRIWIITISLALLSHPLLDLLTPYGTQLLLPFSDARFAINAMPIIDPVYTLLLGFGLLGAWLAERGGVIAGGKVALLTLILSSSYLGYGWLQNIRTEAAATDQLAAIGISDARIAAFPTIGQVHLRRVVARTDTTDRVGFYSTWTPCPIVWFDAPRADPARYTPFLQTRAGRVFDWFSMGWAHYQVHATPSGTRLQVSDLRYGFDDDPLASVFTLHAELDHSGALTSPVQAGRSVPDDSTGALRRLIAATYAPACRIFNRGVIVPAMDDNEASEPK